MPMIILPERPCDAAAIEALLDRAFGPGRGAKTVYRLRAGVPHLTELSLVAADGGRLVGSLRFWPVAIAGASPALLLGPLAVAPERRAEGIGAALMRAGLARAAALGHRIVLLVGDAPYYRRFAFSGGLTRTLDLPGPVDRDRFLGLELVPGALHGLSGMLTPVLPAGGRAGAATAPARGARGRHAEADKGSSLAA